MKKFNKKILCFSGTYYSGFESNDLRLVKELKKNFNVIYAVKSNEMLTNYKRNIKIKKNKNIFFKFYNLINSRDKECGFPGFDLKWKKKIIYKKHNTIWINKWSQLFKLIDDCHVVVLGSFRDNLKIIAYARQKNKIVLVHKNPSNFDSEGQILPNIFCVTSEIQKKKNSKTNYF